MCVLDGVSTPGHFRVLGVNPCAGVPLHLDSRMETDQGIYPWVSTLVMGNLMGRRFWVGRGCFFLGGRGRGNGTPGSVLLRRFHRTTRVQTVLSVCYILYVEQWGFRCSMSSDHREGGPVLDPRLPSVGIHV
jgi:hypothetical protein